MTTTSPVSNKSLNGLLKSLSNDPLWNIGGCNPIDGHTIEENENATESQLSSDRKPSSATIPFAAKTVISSGDSILLPTNQQYTFGTYSHTFSNDSTTPSTIYGIREVPNSDTNMLQAIARFRFDTWCAETKVNESLFPDGLWLEDIDYTARHWITEDITTGKIVATGRMTVHDRLEDNLDGHLWIEQQMTVPLPVGHLSKLVVDKSVRKLGIGRRMSELRMSAAQAMGAKSMLVTASVANSRLLFQLGWVDTGIRVVFPDRPDMEFMGLEVRF